NFSHIYVNHPLKFIPIDESRVEFQRTEACEPSLRLYWGMAKVKIWGGGPYHPYKEEGGLFVKTLESLGHQGQYSENRQFFDAAGLEETRMLVLMGLDCSGAEKVSA